MGNKLSDHFTIVNKIKGNLNHLKVDFDKKFPNSFFSTTLNETYSAQNKNKLKGYIPDAVIKIGQTIYIFEVEFSGLQPGKLVEDALLSSLVCLNMECKELQLIIITKNIDALTYARAWIDLVWPYIQNLFNGSNQSKKYKYKVFSVNSVVDNDKYIMEILKDVCG